MEIDYRQTPFSMRAVYTPPDIVMQTLSDPYLHDAQTVLNRLFGATPDKPLKIPIELPEISLSKQTMDDLGQTVLEGAVLIGLAMILGKVIEGTLRQ